MLRYSNQETQSLVDQGQKLLYPTSKRQDRVNWSTEPEGDETHVKISLQGNHWQTAGKPSDRQSEN
jgi:hypothetical protein